MESKYYILMCMKFDTWGCDFNKPVNLSKTIQPLFVVIEPLCLGEKALLIDVE